MKVTKYRGVTFYRPVNKAEHDELVEEHSGHGCILNHKDESDLDTYAFLQCAGRHDDESTSDAAEACKTVIYDPPGTGRQGFGRALMKPDDRCVANTVRKLQSQDSQPIPAEAP